MQNSESWFKNAEDAAAIPVAVFVVTEFLCYLAGIDLLTGAVVGVLLGIVGEIAYIGAKKPIVRKIVIRPDGWEKKRKKQGPKREPKKKK